MFYDLLKIGTFQRLIGSCRKPGGRLSLSLLRLQQSSQKDA